MVQQIFDSHFHIIDPKFPLVANQSYLPPYFTVEDYQSRIKNLNISGGAIVSGSFQAFDQTYLLAALKKMGPRFVGVAQLPASTSDQEILDYNKAGIRAVRFNLKRGGSETIDNMEEFAQRVYELADWHCELYIDSKNIPELSKMLLRLPRLSIDHLGLSHEGLPHLLALVEKGVKVKATGFGRGNFTHIASVLKEITKINPDALMFGTDLPCTRAKRPFSEDDLKLIKDSFSDDLLEKIFYSNALQLYKPSLF